ncbi:MAG: NfeD family protein [Halocynthiibacter sp.]
MWELWWVWLSAALLLAILEILAPGFILLGFAFGAAVVGLLMLIGVSFGSIYWAFLVMALVSLVAWLVLRRVMGVQKNQRKTWTTDINDH